MTARKLVHQVGSPWVASQVQPLWRPLVLWGVPNFHTTTNGREEQPGMNGDLVRTLFFPWDGERHQQGTSEKDNCAQG